MTAATSAPKNEKDSGETGTVRTRTAKARASNAQDREQDKLSAQRSALASTINSLKDSDRVRKGSMVEVVSAPLSLEALEVRKREQELRKLGHEEMGRRHADFKKNQEKRSARLKALASDEDTSKVVIENPTEEYLEGSIAAETYILAPGDNEILPIKEGMSADQVAGHLLAQLGSRGITMRVDSPKKKAARAEQDDETLRRQRASLVSGRGGASGHPPELVEGFLGVENPSAGERAQPLLRPNDQERWTPEQLENASIFPEETQPYNTSEAKAARPAKAEDSKAPKAKGAPRRIRHK